MIVEHEDTLDKAVEVVLATELLPGEDPALLPGPDRFERYQVVRTLTAASAAAAAHT